MILFLVKEPTHESWFVAIMLDEQCKDASWGNYGFGVCTELFPAK